MPTKCLGRNRDGSACSATPKPSGWCLWHDPALATERASWRRRGGERRSNQARAQRSLPNELLTLREVQAALCRALRKTEAGEMTPAVANALGGLGRSIAAVAEAGDLEERLSALEQQAGGADNRKGWTA